MSIFVIIYTTIALVALGVMVAGLGLAVTKRALRAARQLF